MNEDAGILDGSAFDTVDYDLRHWIPVPDRYVEAVAEAHGARALAVAVLKLLLLVIALAAEKRRRRKSVRELAAHLPTASRNRAWHAQRYAHAYWSAWEQRGKDRRTNAGQQPPREEPQQSPKPRRDPRLSAAGRKRDTSRDTPRQDRGLFSRPAGTASGHSRKRACTATPLTDLNSTPHPPRHEDPIQRDPVSHPVEGVLPPHIARPLQQAGLRCLTEVARFSRDGITGLVPKLARFASLEAIEGALRRSDLSWSGAGWQPPIQPPSLFEEPPEPEPIPPVQTPAYPPIDPKLIARLNAQHGITSPRGQ